MNFSPQEIFNLTGKSALVTGSSRGIGAAIAQAFAAAGARVFVHGKTRHSADRTRDAILSTGGKADSVYGDLGILGQATELVRSCEIEVNGLDIVVINASAQINAPLSALSIEDLTLQFDTNLRSTVELLQACLPGMAERGWGRVVNIGSVNQTQPKSIVTAYAATKAAQHNLIQSQARQYAASGVLLNTLSPGLIDTDRATARKTENMQEWLEYTRNVNWMGRAGETHEMVGAALLLSSNACSFMTGEVITLSGGM